MDNIFATNLKKLRIKKGLSTTELGKIIGINSATVLTYENGRSHPTLPKVAAIIRYFGVSAEYMIFGETDDPPQEKPKTEIKEDSYIKLPLEDKIKYLRIGLSIQGISMDDDSIRKMVVTYEKILKKGGAFSIHDALSVEQGVKGDDMKGE